ncbi:hypothetical protein Hanom_Chr10g00934141 [Helianthus anomalus]
MQRFAFVNFLNVAKVQDLELALKNIILGENKLFISVAKFVDGNFVGNKKAPVKETVKKDEKAATSRSEEVYRSAEHTLGISC